MFLLRGVEGHRHRRAIWGRQIGRGWSKGIEAAIIDPHGWAQRFGCDSLLDGCWEINRFVECVMQTTYVTPTRLRNFVYAVSRALNL